MNRTVFSRTILIALGSLLLIGVIAILISVGRAIFGGGSSSSSSIDAGRAALLTNADNMSVELNIRGPIIADESFTTVTMNISSRNRSVTRYNGYSRYTADNISLPNTYHAYDELIYALDRAGFMNGQTTSDVKATSGVCATGKLYELKVKKGDHVIKELWTSSCKAEKGTLKGEFQPIYNLFTAQIPGGADVVAGLSPSSK